MRKQTTMDYALQVLKKHEHVLEINLQYTPGIVVHVDNMSIYKKQLREVRRAIRQLEKIEVTRKN